MRWQDNIVLLDPDILSERHVPQELLVREELIRRVLTSFRPLSHSRKPMNCWFFGRPGTGKTATAHWVLRKLNKEAGVRGVYVNCWENPTFFSVLDSIARELRMLGAERFSTSFKLERVKRHLSRERVVLVLDEIDQPAPRERNAILYNLSDLLTVGLICVCNSQFVYFGLEDRVKSRLNPVRILFEEYSSGELLDILNQRAQYALTPYSYTEDLLETIARLSDGDARIAIHTLKNAAYLAEHDARKEITPSHAKQAWNSAKDLKKSYLLRRLTDHHRLLYELVQKNSGILSGDLWRLYLKTCEDRQIKPIAVRTYSDYCNKLAELGLVQAKRAAIQGKVREFSVIK